MTLWSDKMTALAYNQQTVNLSATSNGWNLAMSLVDYPVYLKPLHFYHGNIEMSAEGTTNTGRDTEFFGVVVDRHKDDNLSMIAAVTDTYGTIPAVETYKMLHDDIQEMSIESKPNQLYVSGDGGRQVLWVDIEGMMAPSMSDEIGMQVKLFTSLDGSKKHTLQLVAYNKDDGSELVGITNESFTLSSRHTRTIQERHIAFQSTISKLIGEWNETIIPTMALMGDATFNRADALELLGNITEDAKLADKHIKASRSAYQARMMEQSGQDSIYSVVAGLSDYVQRNIADDKPEHAEKVREQINKVAQKHINKSLKQLGYDPAAI